MREVRDLLGGGPVVAATKQSFLILGALGVGLCGSSLAAAQVDPAEAPVVVSAPADPVLAVDPAAQPPSEAPQAVATPVQQTTETPSEGAEAIGAGAADNAAALDEPVADDTAEPSETSSSEEKVPWRNSIFSWGQSINTYAFDQSAGISYNPTYSWNFSFRPRWYFSDKLSLRLREDLDVELTDSDGDTYQRQAIFSDLSVDLGYAKIVDVAGFSLSGGGRISLPLSIASRANSVYLGAGVFANAAYDVDVLEGLSLTGDFAYSHTFSGSNVTQTADENTICTLATDSPSVSRRGCIGGPSNIGDRVTLGIGASLSPVERLSVGVGFTWFFRRANSLGDAVVPVPSAPGGTITLEDGSNTHWRNLTDFAVTVGYDVLDGLNLELAFDTYTTQLNPNGTRRNPFYNADTVVSLTATATLDQLYGLMTGDSHDVTQASTPVPAVAETTEATSL